MSLLNILIILGIIVLGLGLLVGIVGFIFVGKFIFSIFRDMKKDSKRF